MITSLEWQEKVEADWVEIPKRVEIMGCVTIKMERQAIRRKAWVCALGLMDITIIEKDLYYVAAVDGTVTFWPFKLGLLSRTDRDSYRVFICPDLEDAKRSALGYALGFLKRDLVIVCGELGVPVP